MGLDIGLLVLSRRTVPRRPELSTSRTNCTQRSIILFLSKRLGLMYVEYRAETIRCVLHIDQERQSSSRSMRRMCRIDLIRGLPPVMFEGFRLPRNAFTGSNMSLGKSVL